MSHCVEAFLFPESLYRRVLEELPGAHFVWAPQELVMVPLTEALQERLADKGVAAVSGPYEQFYRLSAALALKLQALSKEAPVAYIETEYHEGVGSQAAILWENGAVTLGPLKTTIEEADGQFILSPPEEYAINQVLRRLGVDKGDAPDEFEAMGLRRHRSNAGWEQAASTSRPAPPKR